MLILIVIAMKIAARRHNYQVKYASSYVEHQRQSAEHQAWTSGSQRALGIDLLCCSSPGVNAAPTAVSPRKSFEDDDGAKKRKGL